MVVKNIEDIIICHAPKKNGDLCKSSEFSKIGSDQDVDLRSCKKCKNIIDFKAKAEDVKHKIYHEEGKEPDDKQNLSEPTKNEKRWKQK